MGHIYVRPTPDVEKNYADRVRLRARRQAQYAELRDKPCITKDGQKVRGVKKNEDAFSIQVMDMRERIQGYLKSSVEVAYDKNSLMPAFDPKRLSDGDLSDLVGYLSTLRGYDVAVR